MYYSGYMKWKGCDQSQSSSSLTEFQCDIIYWIQFGYLVVGFLGCFIHSYVAFSYVYQQIGVRTPIETIILSFSLYDLFCCFGLFSYKFLHFLPVFNWRLNCIIVNIFQPFWIYGLLLMILMLAANRFYAICCPVPLYDLRFSERSVIKYTTSILAFTTLISVTQVMLNNCIWKNDIITYFASFNKYILISVYVLFLCLVIYLYVRIQIKFRKRIAEYERISFLAGGALDDDLTEDRTYIRALSFALAINLIILLLGGIVTGVSACTDFNVFTDLDNHPLIVTLSILHNSAALVFVINPFIFYSTSNEFRMKLARPLSAIRGAVGQENQMPIAKLKTEINPWD